MRSSFVKALPKGLVGCAASVLFFGITAFPQSSLQDHPTPIVRNEIEATIKARDVGDARLTTHYYWFEGAQGDVFINWKSKNFAGDVDLFIQSGQRSLTKMVVYADFGEVETGRVIYLRKPERLLLRVQGRTPNDEPATYRLKFAGSFVAATANENDVPVLPSVGESVAGTVRVNSVGTILPPAPKPAESKALPDIAPVVIEEKVTSEPAEPEKKAAEPKGAGEEKKDAARLEVVVENTLKEAEPAKSASSNKPPRRTRIARNRPVKKPDASVKQPDASAKPEGNEATTDPADNQAQSLEKPKIDSKEAAEKPKPPAKVDPLANVQLVIMFKDGSKIERPLPEVFRFTVNRGVLTVVSKDGRVGKYQMIDVAKVTIE